MDQDRILYRGEAFTLTGNSLRQDAAHWAEVQPDGQVKTMKNVRYSEWRIFPEAGNAPHYVASGASMEASSTLPSLSKLPV